MKSNNNGVVPNNENCINCLHSVNHKGAIACGDCGDFLRMFIGLRHIKNPHIKKCNHFTPIPSHVSKTCKYCKHFGDYKGANACWNIDALTLVLMGPYLKQSTETCFNFEMAEEYKATKIKERIH